MRSIELLTDAYKDIENIKQELLSKTTYKELIEEFLDDLKSHLDMVIQTLDSTIFNTNVSDKEKFSLFHKMKLHLEYTEEAISNIGKIHQGTHRKILKRLDGIVFAIEKACVNHFNIPTAYASSSSVISKDILKQVTDRGWHNLPWDKFEQTNANGSYPNKSLELRSRTRHNTVIRQFLQRKHATIANMRRLIAPGSYQQFDHFDKSNGVAFFVGGTYGSGKSSSLKLAPITETLTVHGWTTNFKPQYALAADPIKYAMRKVGKMSERDGVKQKESFTNRVIYSSYNNLHFESSGSEFDARDAILRTKGSTENGSFIYDGSLGSSGDVRAALNHDKSVVVKFSLIPAQQSLIRVLARTGGEDPKIPFSYVIRSYKSCINSLKELRQMQQENPSRMILEVYGPTYNYEHVSDVQIDLNYTYQNGPGKNILIHDERELDRLIADYEADFYRVEMLANQDKLSVGDVCDARYFSPNEWDHLQTISHIRHLTNYNGEDNLRKVMNRHAQQSVKPKSKHYQQRLFNNPTIFNNSTHLTIAKRTESNATTTLKAGTENWWRYLRINISKLSIPAGRLSRVTCLFENYTRRACTSLLFELRDVVDSRFEREEENDTLVSILLILRRREDITIKTIDSPKYITLGRPQ